MPRHTDSTSRAPTPVDIRVGEKIRKLRLDRNLTLAELGLELGISHQQLQKYETGTNRLSAGMLYAVAKVLRIEIHDLFDEVDEPAGKDPLKKVRDRCSHILARTDDPQKLASMQKVLSALAVS
jgi:transcriptional regulator with XRE-family HTH domain